MYKQNLVCQTWCNNISFPLSTAILQAQGGNTLQEKKLQKWINGSDWFTKKDTLVYRKKKPKTKQWKTWWEKQNILFCVG